ncbi:hypothetical protein LRB78_00005, partial [Borreliella americana]|nr:hypothetical protein [Borreliella americana]
MKKRINGLKLALKSLEQIKFFCKSFKIKHCNKNCLLQIYKFIFFSKAKKSTQKYISKNPIQ